MRTVVERVERLEDVMASLVRQAESAETALASYILSTEEYRRTTDKKIEEYRKETTQKIEEYRNETVHKIEEYRKETAQKIEEYRKETAQKIEEYRKETTQKIEEYRKETTQKIEEYRKETDRKIEEQQKQWGQLANKMGTLVEDLFIPSIQVYLEKAFQCVVSRVMPRVKQTVGGQTMEIDIVVVSEDKRVFVIEVKSRPNRADNIKDLQEDLRDFLTFFPEYTGYQLIPIYAGLCMDKSIVSRCTNNKIYAMVVKGDILEILNLEAVQSASSVSNV
jgi:hypothetical protein